VLSSARARKTTETLLPVLKEGKEGEIERGMKIASTKHTN
jgi:hypothetical protein